MRVVRHTHDPRERQDGLGWVSRAVFPDPRIRLTITPGTAAGLPDRRPTARYAVVPSVERARFLLPLASRRVGAAATLAYNALRPPRVRMNRLMVGLLAGLGATGLVGMPVLTVTAPVGPDPAEVLLTERLAALFGCRLHTAIGIRPPDPHHKPTLQLFDDQGRARGYAKVGWNDATRAMVRTEAEALREPPRTSGDFPDRPRLLHALADDALTVTVVAPMPARVRRLRHPERPRLAAMLAVARRGGPPTPARPLRGSSFLADLVTRAERTERQALVAIRALAARDGGRELEFGDWHGDWVPWNLGTYRGRLLAWDWENRGSDRPIGFDLAHQAFQIALSVRGRPVADAAREMDRAFERYGPALGLTPDRYRLLGDAYLIELWLRTAELAAAGGGWSERLQPALPRILASRLT